MQLSFLQLNIEEGVQDSDSYLNKNSKLHDLYVELIQSGLQSVSIIQRSVFEKSVSTDRINYYFLKDGFAPRLRWWQEPERAIELLKSLKSNIIHVFGLDLPLQFRWIRRVVGEKCLIIGQHTGELTWANRNLWLQQFGLRVVDAFIFERNSDSNPWLKASIILPRQPVFELEHFLKKPTKNAKTLKDIYNSLL